jgi:hypothetical protein
VGVLQVRDAGVRGRWRIRRALLRERQRWTALGEDELVMPMEWRAGYVEGIRIAEVIIERNGR